MEIWDRRTDTDERAIGENQNMIIRTDITGKEGADTTRMEDGASQKYKTIHYRAVCQKGD